MRKKNIEIVIFYDGVEVTGLTEKELKPYSDDMYVLKYVGKRKYKLRSTHDVLYRILFELTCDYNVTAIA